MTLTEAGRELWKRLMNRRFAYIAVFRNPHGDNVLRDLARFCRAFSSTGNPDPYVAARLDGRREVWLRISEHLNLSPDELWKLYSGRPTPGGDDASA